MTKVDPPLRNCVKKINDAWLHATNMKPKEICLSPIPAGEFISFFQNAELIFSNLSAAGPVGIGARNDDCGLAMRHREPWFPQGVAIYLDRKWATHIAQHNLS